MTLREFAQDGLSAPVVFCEARGPQGQTIDQYDRYNVSTNASVRLGMDEFDRFICDFFHVPVSQQTGATGDGIWTSLALDVDPYLLETVASGRHYGMPVLAWRRPSPIAITV